MVVLRKFINPLIELLTEITDSNYDNQNPTITQENPHLQNVINLLTVLIKSELSKIDDLQKDIENQIYVIENSTGDDKKDAISVYNAILKDAKYHVDEINHFLYYIDNPYFGQTIFKRKADGIFPATEINTRIGKYALFNPKTSELLITDWRAPITNLYYMYSGPTDNASFTSPAGIQRGELIAKRQFEMSLGRITQAYDIRTGNSSADAFLLNQLTKKIGKKLTDIISTIQEEQNEIIRAKNDQSLIIQGVAGSGKTTILLHRIAYLLYNYKDTIRASNSLIIAPNSMFIDYISDVLPTLGVESIGRNTYLFWAKTILNWNNKYLFANVSDDYEIKRIKGSYKFIKLIDDFVNDYELDILNKIDDKCFNVIYSRFVELKSKYPTMSFEERITLSVEYAFAQIQFKNQTTGNFMGNLESLETRKKSILSYIKKRLNPYRIYKEVFKFAYIFEKYFDKKSESEKLRKYSLSYLQSTGGKTYYKVEDLAPIVWIFFRLYGAKEFIRDYVAVDEAQDLSLFQILTLKKIAKNGNINLAGDIAQSIIPPFYIQSWSEVEEIFNDPILSDKAEIIQYKLNKSYRTTVEIIDYSNKILSRYFPKEYDLPKAILRHGDEVKVLNTKNRTYFEDLKKLVNEQISRNASSIAIVTRTPLKADTIYEYFSDNTNDLPLQVFSYKEDNYHEGIQILPIEKAKGLEFDSVIIADINDFTEDQHDMRLLYVALTRALHRLFVIENTDKPLVLMI